METKNQLKLTAYSHGAGCGCKISPNVLNTILESSQELLHDPCLLIGNDTKDDAAVYRLDERTAIISTTDFFMPIVDDPYDFGGIAATNAMSDVYAMGGTPIMAIAILGWPVDKLPAETAREVLEGARAACRNAGIVIAGGHSIDAPEPIFGLAVTGRIAHQNIRSNSQAQPGCELYLTKPLGIGIMTTAQKKGVLKDEDFQKVRDLMLQLNQIGETFGEIDAVKSMTDVTGFGLLGHLVEMCQGSDVSAEIKASKIPTIEGLAYYLEQKTLPGGTSRNFESYGHLVSPLTLDQKALLCDPQTSGGLLVAVDPTQKSLFIEAMERHQMRLEPFGHIVEKREKVIEVV